MLDEFIRESVNEVIQIRGIFQKSNGFLEICKYIYQFNKKTNFYQRHKTKDLYNLYYTFLTKLEN